MSRDLAVGGLVHAVAAHDASQLLDRPAVQHPPSDYFNNLISNSKQ